LGLSSAGFLDKKPMPDFPEVLKKRVRVSEPRNLERKLKRKCVSRRSWQGEGSGGVGKKRVSEEGTLCGERAGREKGISHRPTTQKLVGPGMA